ncbi:MAG: hypothetical protein ACM3UU_02905 [Ignavibacteriales bacterium]
MEYKKVTRDEVLRVFINASLDIMSPIGGISLVEVANYLKTSRYQVKKIVNELKKEELLELKCVNLSPDPEWDDGVYPPYWGYCLTEKGKELDIYKVAEEKHNKILKECFGI